MLKFLFLFLFSVSIMNFFMNNLYSKDINLGILHGSEAESLLIRTEIEKLFKNKYKIKYKFFTLPNKIEEKKII